MPKSGKNSKGSIDGRKVRQEGEGYEEVSTDLPGGRFQKDKQLPTENDLSVSKSEITDPAGKKTDPISTAATELKAKIKIRPDVSVDELHGKQVGGVPLVGAMETKSVAGVSAQSPADDVSKIPYSQGGYRPQSRYGKKRSEDLFELDNQVSEQVAPNVDDALDLREAPEAKQGYNGRKQFKQTRGKKNFKFVNGNSHDVGKLPQQLLNDASVDFIHTDKLIYSCGQMITGGTNSSNIDIPTGGDYPSKRHDGSTVPVRMHKGNYHLKSFTITTASGHIASITADEDCYEVHADPISRDQANFNLQVDINNITKTLIKLQAKMGRETAQEWSPLGYVIDEPYEYNTIFHDIEAVTGAMMAMAYRAAVSSMAWQRNIAGKDGVNPQRNAVKMITEGFAGVLGNSDKNSILDTEFDHVIFSQPAYQKGSVAGLIKMFDSTGKYRTKADLLGLQRSLSLHLSTCDNNLNPLHVKPNFLKALNKAHMFSTPTGNYNPFLPIMSTRVMQIVNPMSLNVFLKDWKNPANFVAADYTDKFRDQATGTYANYSYSYKDLRNNVYVTRVQHPIIEGLIRWLLKHEGAFVRTFGDGTTITIPADFNFESPALLPFILCSASQDVLYERNIIFRDILFAEDQEKDYIWDDMEGLSKLDPLYSTQLKINGYNQPLTLGKLSPDSLVREMWSGHIQLTVADKNKLQYMLPWYFNEQAFGYTAGGKYTENEGFFEENAAFNMSIPSIRDGVRHEYVDVIKSMEERDIRLALDRIVNIPVYAHKTTTSYYTIYSNYNTSADLNSYIKLSSLRYDPNSDGRVIATYAAVNDNDTFMDHRALYCCAKEIGYIDDLYISRDIIDVIKSKKVGSDTVIDLSAVTHTSPTSSLEGSNAYNGYSPLFITSYRVSGDSYTGEAIDRSAALNQVFYRCFASVDAISQDGDFITKTGIIPCLSWNDGIADDIYGVYNLGSNNESTHVVDKTIRTIAPRIWTMLQRFFLPVNRFENIFNVNENVDYDPLETSFYFGVCGTLASDYTQDVLERLDVYDQLNLDYTEDVFCRDSLIFRQD